MMHLSMKSPSTVTKVDHSMFENSNAADQLKPSPRTAVSSGGSQHLKNALNLGKAMGAKMNDLLRRKEPTSLGDIGVTEINKNAEPVWASLAEMNHGTRNSHISLDSFPRLDPPPPTGKKRLPRALKTTQEMMISSDPVVASPESSFISSPDKTSKDEPRHQAIASPEQPSLENPPQPDSLIEEMPSEPSNQPTSEKNPKEDQSQILLSVPDLIHKDNLDPKKLSGSDSRLSSTPCPGKGGCRISLDEGEVMANGSVDFHHTLGLEQEEPHPDLLSFE
ncbi:hypothetical protein DNTS_008875 [Danionella cerebrum]|uniref:Nitric oxide synthase 1 adaptor protein n=1 Tax=Danionella cerebrum TaxID=2873325 RepID=A0A553R0V2_9TELE|nr:hypothetical protein DNTS_008875 [Danionella translucida]